jgi:hypothetical protein
MSIYISRDVIFDKNIFPFASLHSSAGAHYSAEVLLLPSGASSDLHVHNNPANTNDSARVILSFDLLQPQKITTPGSSPPGGTAVETDSGAAPVLAPVAHPGAEVHADPLPGVPPPRVSIEDLVGVQQHSPRAASSEFVSGFY